MATKSISQLDTQSTANETDLFEVAIVDANSASGYASKKESAAAIADAIVGEYQYPLRITGTTAKTIAGAINELKNLVDLLPQFAIEVVQTLPVSDISETTIYLVPTQDPEQGNYYEEYIYVNNAWELVGTTAVDLSGYYTSTQVDTLLAAKANTSSLATVATSGAYADLSGKPTIDTALDTTSTNAVENRAVASEINSIKSDITVDGSASGDIATFVDGSDNPLKALTISIVAQQSGTGDPSPTNVRPITGWTGAVVNRCGKNFLAKPFVYNAQIDKTISNCFYLKAGTYNFSFKNSTATSWRLGVVLIDENGEYLSATQYMPSPYMSYNTTVNAWIDGSNNVTKTKNINIVKSCYVRMTFLLGDTTAETTFTDVLLEFGNTQTAYEPYNGNTYNINWQSVAGTVGNGTIAPLTGVLSNVSLCANYVGGNSENWYVSQVGSQGYYASIISISNASQPTNKAILCNRFVGVKHTNRSYNNLYYAWVTPEGALNIVQDVATTAAEWKTWLQSNNLQIVYDIATTYQLTPTEIRSLLGINNVWADCGSITELKYTRDLNLCINDIIARLEALESASSNRSLSVSPTLTKSLTSDSDTAEGKTEEETEEETKEEAQKNER